MNTQFMGGKGEGDHHSRCQVRETRISDFGGRRIKDTHLGGETRNTQLVRETCALPQVGEEMSPIWLERDSDRADLGNKDNESTHLGVER